MEISIRGYEEGDLPEMLAIWNEIVEEGEAFPQLDTLDLQSGREFFASQTFCGVATDISGKIAGLYILHPNNVGRCGHICNASYAVASGLRGRGIGEKLVRHSLEAGRKAGFRIMQFNAVGADNHAARKLYEKIGFTQIGIIPGGYLQGNDLYADIALYYFPLGAR